MINFDILNEDQDQEFHDHVESIVARRDPFDPAPINELRERFNAEIQRMELLAMQVQVQDEESCQLATTYTTQAKKLRQEIDKKHKDLKEPYLVYTRTLDGLRKQLSDRIQGLENTLNRKLLPYIQKKERERQELERKARAEAARLQAELDAKARAEADRIAEEARQKALSEQKTEEEAEEAAKAAVIMQTEPPRIVVYDMPPEVKVKTESGTADIKTEWAWEIIDFKALPDEAYQNRCDEVTKALAPYFNARVKAGVRNIPGVKIYQTTKLNTRTRR